MEEKQKKTTVARKGGGLNSIDVSILYLFQNLLLATMLQL